MFFFISVFALSLTLYAKTAYPTVAGGDSGELITCAYTLGEIHTGMKIIGGMT